MGGWVEGEDLIVKCARISEVLCVIQDHLPKINNCVSYKSLGPYI